MRQFEKDGGIVFEFLAAIYLFIGIAIVADDYFIIALEIIADKLHMSEDVVGYGKSLKIDELVSQNPIQAGATLMAVGSSAPELFTNIASVLSSTQDQG